jgi:hypothetical protein
MSFLLFPTTMQDTAGHQSTHLIRERRRHTVFPPPIDKELD